MNTPENMREAQMQHLSSPVRMDTTSKSGNMLANGLATPADQLPNRHRQNFVEMLDATLAGTNPGGTDESNLYTGIESFFFGHDETFHDGGFDIDPSLADSSSSLLSSTQQGSMANFHKSYSPGPVARSTTRLASAPTTDPVPQRQKLVHERVGRILEYIHDTGFNSVDSFLLSYYTSSFAKSSGARSAQETSRLQGLPALIDDLSVKSRSWPPWESSRYRHAIVKSAANLLQNELDGLSKKRYSGEIQMWQNLQRNPNLARPKIGAGLVDSLEDISADLRLTLRDEVPSLQSFMAILSADASETPRVERVQLFLSTIQLITSTKEELLQDVVSWVNTRRRVHRNRRYSLDNDQDEKKD
ncbi:hypothetical protein F5Y18DRAFT_397387 [Xylariaceae sp. FL1019]|nr:hypothetical protein F5Y18DRAFT_397387 [Xylariaceae sp. FL1019]